MGLVDPPAILALTAAYGSAYCIVLLTRGPRSGSGRNGAPPAPNDDDGGAALCGLGAGEDDWYCGCAGWEYPGYDVPNPVGAGSENAPYASILGRPAGTL